MAISDLFSTEADEADDGSARPTDSEFEFDEIQADPDDPLTVARNEELIAAELEASKSDRRALVARAMSQINELVDLVALAEASDLTAKKEIDHCAALSSEIADVKLEIADTSARVDDREKALDQAKETLRRIEVLREYKQNEIQDVVRSVNSAEIVDLAFVIDATWSMKKHIDNVKRTMVDIVERIKSTNGDLQLRLAVVAYRDIEHDKTKNRFEILDFVRNDEVFRKFLKGLDCVRSDDDPEDMAGGIQKARLLSWSSPTRVVFIVANGPCHGKEFHNRMDNYPQGTPGIDVKEELRLLALNHGDDGSMTVFFGRLADRTDQMISCFHQHGIKLHAVEFEDAIKIASSVTWGVRSSIFKTVSASVSGKGGFAFSMLPTQLEVTKNHSAMAGSGSAELKQFSIVNRLPASDEWQSQPPTYIKTYRSRPIKAMEDLKAPYEFGILKYCRGSRTDSTATSKMLLRCASDPFAEGEMRLAYHGQLATSEEELGLEKSYVVLKSFKYVGDGVNDLKQYLRQMEVSNVAFYLAAVYNKSYRRSRHGRVAFLPVCVVEDVDESKEDAGTRRFCAEPTLPPGSSSFTQYSNNTGYWNQEHLDETLLRFTDFTHRVTDQYLMVTDLQGVRKGNDFYLTDPVVLCKDILRFGRTNLGEPLMHKCISATWAIMKEKGW
jgi:hypothetical protein